AGQPAVFELRDHASGGLHGARSGAGSPLAGHTSFAGRRLHAVRHRRDGRAGCTHPYRTVRRTRDGRGAFAGMEWRDLLCGATEIGGHCCREGVDGFAWVDLLLEVEESRFGSILYAYVCRADSEEVFQCCGTDEGRGG